MRDHWPPETEDRGCADNLCQTCKTGTTGEDVIVHPPEKSSDWHTNITLIHTIQQKSLNRSTQKFYICTNANHVLWLYFMLGFGMTVNVSRLNRRWSPYRLSFIAKWNKHKIIMKKQGSFWVWAMPGRHHFETSLIGWAHTQNDPWNSTQK